MCQCNGEAGFVVGAQINQEMRHRLVVMPFQHLAMPVEPGNTGAVAEIDIKGHGPDPIDQSSVKTQQERFDSITGGSGDREL